MFHVISCPSLQAPSVAVHAQVGSLRMVLSLEELGPAVQQLPHQGPVDTATAAAAAAAQPTASLGAAGQSAANLAQATSGGSQAAAANPVSAALHASGSTVSGRLTMCALCHHEDQPHVVCGFCESVVPPFILPRGSIVKQPRTVKL